MALGDGSALAPLQARQGKVREGKARYYMYFVAAARVCGAGVLIACSVAPEIILKRRPKDYWEEVDCAA